MSRRSNGNGAVYPYTARGKRRYRVQWFEPIDPAYPEGEKRRPSKSGFKTEQEASTFLRQKLHEIDQGRTTPKTKPPTVEEHLRDFLDSHRVEDSTLTAYRRMARLHVIPYLGGVRITALTPSRLAEHYRRLERSGMKAEGRDGQGLGPGTVRKVHQMLSVALDTAVIDGNEGWLPSNPAKHRNAKPPTQKAEKEARPEITVWSPAQMHRFLAWTKRNDPDYHPYWVLMFGTGVRRSEAVGHTWGDFDLNRSRVQVLRARVTIKEKGKKEYHRTKRTKSSHARAFDLDRETTLPALRELRTSRARSMGIGAVSRDKPVLLNTRGERIRPDYLTRRWDRAMSLYLEANPQDLPELTLHGIRHTHASHLIASGASPKAVQHRLGHATVAVTMDIYTHLFEDAEKDVIDRYATYMKGAVAQEADEAELG